MTVKNKTDEQASEFGQGLCYCLGLFLAHTEGIALRRQEYMNIRNSKDTKCAELFTDDDAIRLWFYGSSDHMFDLIPDSAPAHLVRRVLALKNKCLEWRLPMDGSENPTVDNAFWAIQEAKDLLREIDMHHGVPVIKGSWE